MQRGGDFAAPGAGRERDAVDQGTDGFRCFVALLRALERLGKAFHLSTIDAGDVRVKVRYVHRRLGKAGAQLVLPRFELAQASQQGAATTTVLNERDDLLYGSCDLVQLAPVGVAG